MVNAPNAVLAGPGSRGRDAHGPGIDQCAVAERLTVSVRTVESHIYRAMAKTGTITRDELAT
jgi:hypothetical protein